MVAIAVVAVLVFYETHHRKRPGIMNTGTPKIISIQSTYPQDKRKTRAAPKILEIKEEE
jgi:hypothetical protein